MSVGAVTERKERPAHVRFVREAREDKAASLAAGHYVAKDVDIVLITPPYSKDEVRQKATQWIENMQQDVRNGRMPPEWQEFNLKAYRAWQNGQELPLNGTPIRGWMVISPAQQETLIRMMVLTLEDLASINEEGLRRIGMGALELKNKAIASLQAVKDHGPLVMENAALKTEVEHLKSSQVGMQAQINELRALVPQAGSVTSVSTESISADDILPEPEPRTLTIKKK
tara:strand:- start:1244 stop:1927 length:684 start_codon:yes stop_codon:yes gene_type:complete